MGRYHASTTKRSFCHLISEEEFAICEVSVRTLTPLSTPSGSRGRVTASNPRRVVAYHRQTCVCEPTHRGAGHAETEISSMLRKTKVRHTVGTISNMEQTSCSLVFSRSVCSRLETRDGDDLALLWFLLTTVPPRSFVEALVVMSMRPLCIFHQTFRTSWQTTTVKRSSGPQTRARLWFSNN